MKLKLSTLILLLFLPLSALANPGAMMLQMGGSVAESSGGQLLSHVTGAEDDGDALETGTGVLSISGTGHCTDHNSVASGGFLSGTASMATIEFPVSSNFDGEQGTIEGYYVLTGTIDPNSYLFSVDSDAADFGLYRGGANTNLKFNYNGTTIDVTGVAVDIYDGDPHYIKAVWEHDGADINMTLTVDTSEHAGVSATVAVYVESGNFNIGRGAYGDNFEGCIDNVKIYSE